MIRAAYRCLVWMHPPSFRREFGGEMLWIYDQAAQTRGAAPLLLDGVVSLVRQWLLRHGFLKFPLALAGALIQVTVGGFAIFLIQPFPVHPSPPIVQNPEAAGLIALTAVTVTGLLAAVMFLVFWWRKLARRVRV